MTEPACDDCGNEASELRRDHLGYWLCPECWRAYMSATGGEEEEDSSLCDECGDELESNDLVDCSCGQSFCENCYLEYGHVHHDKDRDEIYEPGNLN